MMPWSVNGSPNGDTVRGEACANPGDGSVCDQGNMRALGGDSILEKPAATQGCAGTGKSPLTTQWDPRVPGAACCLPIP